jgi:hypothetical protein
MPKVKPTAHGGRRKAASKRKASPPRRDAPAAAPQTKAAAEDPFMSSGLSLHELFEQQTRQMLDRTDLDEEQKQNILVAMSCPCCGAGGMSFTAKLKR